MTRLVLVVAAISLAACTHARTNQTGAQIVRTPAPACETAASPLIVIDGVVQPPACAAAKQEAAPKCDSAAPIYVVDGVRACVKP
jgi:hypothetical protein